MSIIPFDKVQSFLVDDAFPLWSGNGVYENGCFVEHLDLRGTPVDPGYTRVRVQARQIYVFSHAEQAGLFRSPGLLPRAIDFFIDAAWQGPDRGWAKLIDRHGGVVDGSSDLYDIAFALFALAWCYRVDPQPRLRIIAHQTIDFLDLRMKHSEGGYQNDAKRSFPRQQNPHMHLVEAMNAWVDATGEARFIAKATEIIDLLESRFCDPETGALGEFFNENWTPVSGARGSIVEPGHQFEWAWIVGHFGRLSGSPRPELMRKLIDFGIRHGFNTDTGLTIDQVDRQGKPLASSRRLWPQTEALKASLAATEFLGRSQESPRIARIIDAIFVWFLNPGPVRGSWIDHYNPNWTPMVDKVPTTSLYHVSLAFLELLRLREKIEANTILGVCDSEWVPESARD